MTSIFPVGPGSARTFMTTRRIGAESTPATPGERFTPPPRIPFDPGDGKFPVFPPRGDMQNPIYLHRPGHLAALSLHFGSPDTNIIVMGEVPVGRDLRQRRGLRVPDLMIAFGVNQDRIIADRGYSIEQWGKPPDFVLEIASENTAENDITVKRDDYAAFGIPEYWRFDPSDGAYYGTGLAGERLVDGAYQPIEVSENEDGILRGHSDVLGLDLCALPNLDLRLYDPERGEWLLDYNEEQAARQAAELQAQTERDARQAAELRIRELEALLKAQNGDSA